jgi:hypothetical protein
MERVMRALDRQLHMHPSPAQARAQDIMVYFGGFVRRQVKNTRQTKIPRSGTWSKGEKITIRINLMPAAISSQLGK